MFEFIFIIAAVFIVGSILFNAASGVAEWSHNNSQPILNKEAKLIGKRVDTRIRRRHRSNSNFSSTSSTNYYYLTFETVSPRERMVFRVKRREFDLLVEDDIGQLTHQGTRYHGFRVM